MQITPDQLYAEAAAMALELRLKERAIEALQGELEKLRGHEHTHSHEAPEGGEG